MYAPVLVKEQTSPSSPKLRHIFSIKNDLFLICYSAQFCVLEMPCQNNLQINVAIILAIKLINATKPNFLFKEENSVGTQKRGEECQKIVWKWYNLACDSNSVLTNSSWIVKMILKVSFAHCNLNIDNIIKSQQRNEYSIWLVLPKPK